MSLHPLQERVIRCRRCPRLVQYLKGIRTDHADWWCRPVPSFGDRGSRILLVGLAPGRSGSNRTGRMFTGDASGVFLFRALHRLGLATQPTWDLRRSLFWPTLSRDGMRLKGVYITAVIRCAPPGNKPLPSEISNCQSFLGGELKLLKSVWVVVALGRIAHEGYLKAVGLKPSNFPFRHGAVYRPDLRGIPAYLVDTYHPSRQNTQTGRLTMAMFLSVLKKAKALAGLT